MLCQPDFLSHFKTLDAALTQQQALWRPRAFYQNQAPWQQPQLFSALLALSDTEVEQLSQHQEQRLHWFSHYLPLSCQQLASFTPANLPPHNSHISPFKTVAIPGRKLEQILAFNQALPSSANSLIEWCAGKGHLGRTIHHLTQQTVHCLEFDQQLCSNGQQLAHKQQADLHFHHHDVLQALPASLHGPEYDHIGLHACGQLHIQLLRTACQQQAQHITLSPCCYHKISEHLYQPLSSAASASKLQLSRQDLQLAQEETVTGGQRIHKLRKQEQLWRLAFDELQQQLSGQPHYQHLPSINKRIFSGSFQDFCQWAAQHCQITLPQQVDGPRYLALGELRLQQVRRLDLVRQLFKRPLEYWLALDRVLYLYQQGYQVQLLEFCPRATSPRNLLITATRQIAQ
ncbi:SAM-dependent methyltransferase [Dasania sp. GY-MA-18]|uniref:SAM-dependent methyltransferase n=1 Tax=Dasania phycosphaerae TaxID=2950436 RepID=A0A9J6RLE4_9GAMM|nr:MULTISPECIES: SAM-dependent methyltransferase [Dasania]MCR8922595.1 SAM-dependent methyltransferase [Dasania sp. GY-MA-18]MCZ0865024.1 SAM-dependent methyltransferase [Dasania phycosphaerae]MCZ0868751.1 SAM-dependent methyltransferase [Dasania phycosphaerae]